MPTDYICNICGIVLRKTAYHNHKRRHEEEGEKRTEDLMDTQSLQSDGSDDDNVSQVTDGSDLFSKNVDFANEDNFDSESSEMENQDVVTSDSENSDLSSENESEFVDEVHVVSESSGEDEDIQIARVDPPNNDVVEAEYPRARSIVRHFLLCLMRLQTFHSLSEQGFINIWHLILTFINGLGRCFRLETLCNFVSLLPRSMYKIKQFLGIGQINDDTVYVQCSKCNKLYGKDEAWYKTSTGSIKSAKCNFVAFKNHPQEKFKRKCGTLLMKKSISPSGKISLVPKKVYCYNSLIKNLTRFISKENVFTNMNMNDEYKILNDIYDGDVAKNFKDIDGNHFLSGPNNIGLMMNVDWFQPFSDSPYSVGAIYFVILNLPRHIRFKNENVILAGVIPGPKEPKGLSMNFCLKPIVKDLNKLWKGVYVKKGGVLVKLRAALMCLSSDIPATRKTGGFIGHTAVMGCSKCLKPFRYDKDAKRLNYSGYDDNEWPERNLHDHLEKAKEGRDANTLAERKEIHSEYGAIYSVLQELKYFDVIRMHVIDPMHNLLLGTGKHIMKVYTEEGILTSAEFAEIQRKVDVMKTPGDVGRVPRKIEGKFTGFTAQQWKNWIMVYCLYALKGVIPQRDLNILRLYVSACRLLCRKQVSIKDVDSGHSLLKRFCIEFCKKYGWKHCTPNMHLHLHLRQCMLDYGPVYSFWCFSFERYNGVLGNYHTNNHDVGVQIMKKFQSDAIVNDELYSIEFGDEPPEVMFENPKKENFVLPAPKFTSESFMNRLFLSSGTPTVFDFSNVDSADRDIYLMSPLRKYQHYLDKDEHSSITEMMQALPNEEGVLQMNLLYHVKRFKAVRMIDLLIKITSNRTERSSCVNARWIGHDSNGRPVVSQIADARPGIVEEILLVTSEFVVGERIIRREIVLLKVNWFQMHGFINHYGTTAPVKIYDPRYEPGSYACYMPVQRVLNRCALARTPIQLTETLYERVAVIVTLTE